MNKRGIGVGKSTNSSAGLLKSGSATNSNPSATTIIHLGDPLPLPYKITPPDDDDETAVDALPKKGGRIRLEKGDERTNWEVNHRPAPRRTRDFIKHEDLHGDHESVPPSQTRILSGRFENIENAAIRPPSSKPREDLLVGHIKDSRLQTHIPRSSIVHKFSPHEEGEVERSDITIESERKLQNIHGDLHHTHGQTAQDLLSSIEDNLNALHLLIVNNETVIGDMETLESIKVQVEKTIGASLARSNPGQPKLLQEHRTTNILDELERLQGLQNSHKYTIEVDYRYAGAITLLLIFFVSSFVVSSLNYEYCYFFC